MRPPRATPLHISPIPPSSPDTAGVVGAKLMGHKPMPVQRQIWELAGARAPRLSTALYPNLAIEVPRRAGKTDALLSLAVGRCEHGPDYLAGYTAQTGAKSRERFYALLRRMERYGQGTWRARQSRGEERIEWENGSALLFGPPKAEWWRGDAFDLVLLDEAQLVDPVDAAELLGSLLPVFWTRPDAQFVVSGTAGETRDGLLWEALESARAALPGWGILEYALPEGADPDDETNWLLAHPGPAGVGHARALEVLRMAHAQMGPEEFGREVLGRWPELSVAVVFPAALWDSLGVDAQPAQPRRFGLAFEVTPDGDRAAVTATWRDGPLTWGGVLEEAEGMAWVAPYVASVARRARLPVWHDSTPNNSAVASQIARALPGVAVHACTALEYASGCALLHSEVTAGTFRHSRQPALDAAVGVAAKRPLLDGGWAWGRKASTGYIHPLVALSVGLRAFDTLPQPRMTKVLSAQVR